MLLALMMKKGGEIVEADEGWLQDRGEEAVQLRPVMWRGAIINLRRSLLHFTISLVG